MLAQDCPGVNSARTICCTGNWDRRSPQNPIVDDVPSCKKVTKVTWTVVPFCPTMALSCMTLTDPLTLEKVGEIAPRTKMLPHPVRVVIR